MCRSAVAVALSVGLLLANISVFNCVPVKSSEPALLVISFDAFRPEYFNRNVTPHLNQFRRDGLSAPFLLNVFPSKTFVNHHTIATGLYPDAHGVMANDGYDQQTGRVVGYDLFHYNESIVPIWLANELAGKHSGCMMWPGSNYTYSGRPTTFNQGFDPKMDPKTRVDIALNWFVHKKTPANLVMLYVEEPDTQSHIWGPDAKIITDTVAMLDKLSAYIQQKLIDLNLDKRVNVVHLSDHGMSSVSPPNFIDLRPFLENGTYSTYGTSPVLQIVPKDPSLQNKIFAKLTKAAEQNGHFKVYDRNNLPAKWHMQNERRMGPILAVADFNYAFHDMIFTAEYYKETYNISITNTTKYGIHGYDVSEESMHAIFMAKGPLFPAGSQLDEIKNVDLYSFFCHILKIKCDYNGIHGTSLAWEKLQKLSKKSVIQRR